MSLLKDLRHGARKLVHNPGFSAISVVTLALGIGLTTTMFSIVYGAMLKGLPFPNADELIAVQRENLARGFQRMSTPIHDYLDYRDDYLLIQRFYLSVLFLPRLTLLV